LLLIIQLSRLNRANTTNTGYDVVCVSSLNPQHKKRFIIHLIIHEMKMLSINFYNFHIHKCCLFYRKKEKN